MSELAYIIIGIVALAAVGVFIHFDRKRQLRELERLAEFDRRMAEAARLAQVRAEKGNPGVS